MKRALVIVPSILVVLLAVALIAPGFIDWNQYKTQAQEQVKTMTGLEMELAGDIGFTILPAPRIMAENVTVKAPEGSKEPILASLDRLDVNVDLFPLLSGQVSVKYVTLVKPAINLEMLESGKLNAMTPEIEALQSPADNKAAKAAGPDIALDKVVIDNGTFSYYDHATQTQTTVRNINADLMAKSLQGPYEASGSLFYEGHSAEFEVSAARLKSDTGQIEPKIRLTLRPADLELAFSGTLSTKEPFGGQGVLTAGAPSLKKVMDQFKLGPFAARDSSLKLKGVLTADSGKLDFRNFELALGEDQISGTFGMLFDPMKYALEIKAHKGVEVARLADLPMFRHAIFDIRMEGDAASAKIHSSTVKLDSQEFKLSGNYAVPKKVGRPKADIVFSAAALDYDALAKKMPEQKSRSSGDIESSLQALALPLDMDLDLNVSKLKYEGKTLDKVGAKLKFRENAVSFSGISIRNIFASADISASGEIRDIKNAAGITLDLAVNTRDVPAFSKALNIDASAFPPALKTAEVKTRLTGSAKAMDMTANIGALGGDFIAQGKIGHPFKTATLDDLTLQVKHKNMADLMQKLQGTPKPDPNFARPMDIYAKIVQSGKTYTLSGLKGDLAGYTVQGDAKIDTSGAKPYIGGELKFGKITMASAVTTQAASKPGADGSERWSREPINVQGLNAFNADVALSASSITYGPWPLIAPQMKIALKDGVLDISEMKAGLFEGALAMNATVESSDKPRQPVRIKSNASLKDVSVKQLIRALAGSQMIDATGKVSGDLDITTSGTSAAALVYDLGGQGTVNGSDIILNGVDVTRFARALSDETKPGDSLLGLWKGSVKGGSTQFDTLDGNYVIAEGVVDIRKLDLDGPKANIATTGNINLPKWTLATRHKITVKPQGDVPSDVPPFEMSFSGSLDNPAQTFGQGVLQDYLNRKVSRKIEGLINKKLGLPGADEKQGTPEQVVPSGGEEQKNTQPPAEKSPEDLIQQILQPQSQQQSEEPAQQTEQPPAEQQAQQPPRKEEKKDVDPEDVVKDVLKGLLR